MDGYAQCYNDKALNFRGNDAFTLEAWVKPEASEETSPIITKGNDEWMCTQSYGFTEKLYSMKRQEKRQTIILSAISTTRTGMMRTEFMKSICICSNTGKLADNWYLSCSRYI